MKALVYSKKEDLLRKFSTEELEKEVVKRNPKTDEEEVEPDVPAYLTTDERVERLLEFTELEKKDLTYMVAEKLSAISDFLSNLHTNYE